MVNDSAQRWNGTVSLERLRTDASPETATHGLYIEATHQFEFDVAPRGKTEIPLPQDLQQTDQPQSDVLVVRSEGIGFGDRILHLYAEDKDRITEPARITARCARVRGGVEVTVTAQTIVRDLVLQADRIDPAATVSEQCVSLLPGESHTFRITSAFAPEGTSETDVWCRYPVLQGVGIREDSILLPDLHKAEILTPEGTRW
ncbi:hypothetical protein [Arthrobacter sp. C9C5]|uniref:hypothetical protein n=1 Tax=Arthrobacter sp. C9C5 TaxID=2735267 RepID=UPI00201BD261|nr:hypothetical protein [Arthrobacter sp. C9C5]